MTEVVEEVIVNNFACESVQYVSTDDWILYGGFLLILLGIATMFWGLTFICEEYCVPAITIYCIRNNVSDNVAGSILIGAGLSLPVLFSSYVGLFASSSSIGLGTVLGGNIFNQTVNIAASVFVAPNRRLKLCKVTLSKEVLMYGISNLLIIWALEHDLYRSLAKVSDIKNWFRCLSVPWEYSMALVLFYFVYCLIAVYGERVFNFRFQIYNICGRMTRSPKPTLPSIQETCHELPNNLSEESSSDDVQFTRPFNCMPGKIQLSPSKCSDVQMDPTSVEFDLAAIDDQSSEDVAETGNAVTSIATDFILLKKTNSCKLLCSDKWKVRYCSFHDEGFISYRNKKSLPIKGRHARYVDLSNSNGSLVQDPIKFEFSINAIYPEKRTFHFQALDKIMFLAVTERINECLHAKKGIYRCELGRLSRIEMNLLTAGTTADLPTSEKGQKSFGTSLNCLELRPVSESVWTVPKGIFHQILYYIIYPIKIIIYYTIPDAKEPGAGNRAIMSIIMSVIWMAIQSYVIIKGLDEIGNLIQVGGTVMGLTIGAIAASYPALWSSIVVAREGNADIALCNALGSNVFNNFLGLGLPWLTYSIVYNNNPYSGIQNNGVVLAFIILNVILFAFYLFVAFNSFELNYKSYPVHRINFVSHGVF